MVKQGSEKTGKTACFIAGACGCLLLALIGFFAAGLIGYLMYQEYEKDRYIIDGENINWNGNYTNNENDALDDVTTNEFGELIGEDGVSHGFTADPIDENLYAFQIGAYPLDHFSESEWPALRITLEYPKVPPMTDGNDVGSLWVGTVLKNDYFIQVGMMSSSAADANGNMQWNYFWQMWDDQDNYLYGLQEPMENYGWHTNETNTFTITCTDPATGEWEFWVNSEVIGKTNTGECAMDIYNGQAFWELTTAKTSKDELPTFGPFTLSNFEYWDGYTWQAVQSAELSYGYGRVIDGTTTNQDSVCPPYGAQSTAGERSFQAGSTLACLSNESVLWE